MSCVKSVSVQFSKSGWESMQMYQNLANSNAKNQWFPKTSEEGRQLVFQFLVNAIPIKINTINKFLDNKRSDLFIRFLVHSQSFHNLSDFVRLFIKLKTCSVLYIIKRSLVKWLNLLHDVTTLCSFLSRRLQVQYYTFNTNTYRLKYNWHGLH